MNIPVRNIPVRNNLGSLCSVAYSVAFIYLFEIGPFLMKNFFNIDSTIWPPGGTMVYGSSFQPFQSMGQSTPNISPNHYVPLSSRLLKAGQNHCTGAQNHRFIQIKFSSYLFLCSGH